MATSTKRLSTYRKNSSGQARVTIKGRDFLLGPFTSKASYVEYDRAIAEFLACARSPLETRPRRQDSRPKGRQALAVSSATVSLRALRLRVSTPESTPPRRSCMTRCAVRVPMCPVLKKRYPKRPGCPSWQLPVRSASLHHITPGSGQIHRSEGAQAGLRSCPGRQLDNSNGGSDHCVAITAFTTRTDKPGHAEHRPNRELSWLRDNCGAAS